MNPMVFIRNSTHILLMTGSLKSKALGGDPDFLGNVDSEGKA